MKKSSKSLGEAFPLEQERVRVILGIYRDLGPFGMFGAATIEQALAKADKAAISGDITQMIASLQELKGIQG